MTDLELARKAQTDQFAVDEQLTELERRLAESNDERAALQKSFGEEIARLQEALAEQRRQADTQSAAFARLDGNDQQLAELRSRYDALDSERQQLLEMAGLLRSEAEARQQTVTELTERLEGLDGERQHAVDTANSLRLDLDERHTLVADLTTRLQLLESDQQQTTESSAQLQRELESRTALANELAGGSRRSRPSRQRCAQRPTPSWRRFGRPARPNWRRFGTQVGSRAGPTAGDGSTAETRRACMRPLEQEHAASSRRASSRSCRRPRPATAPTPARSATR